MEKIIEGLQGGFYIIAFGCIIFTAYTLYNDHKKNKK